MANRILTYLTNRLAVFVISMVALGVTLPAHATTLVTNGSFEDPAVFFGWTQIGDSQFNAVICDEAPDGNCFASFGAVGGTGGISQDLATVAGQIYTISFYLSPDGETPSLVSVSFGGTVLLNVTNPPASDFQKLVFTAIAPTNTTTLSFSFRDDIGSINLDAVSVDAAPEPATLGLMGLALVGLAVTRSRRRTSRQNPRP